MTPDIPCKNCLVLPRCISKLRARLEDIEPEGDFTFYYILEHFIFNTLTLYCRMLGDFQQTLYTQEINKDIIVEFFLERFEDE